MLVGVRAWGLLKALPRLPQPIFSTPLSLPMRFPFSEFFDRQDDKELKEAFFAKHRKQFLHYKLTDHWKKNLERKQRRNERKA